MPDPDPTPEPTTDPAPKADPTPEPAVTTDKPLGDAGKAALDAERKARREAEKAARDAQARLKELEDEKLSETERLRKQAEDGQRLAEQATSKLRQANLRDALAEKGFTGPQARAAAKLLDSIEYDDSDEPTNLDARLEAAAAEYGDLVKPGGQPVTFDGGVRETAPLSKSAEEEHQDFIGALLRGQSPATT